MDTSRPQVDKKIDWHRVMPVFSGALEISADQRAVYIRESCAGDAALIRQVESLLENNQRAGDDFLAPPPPNPNIDAMIKPDVEDLLIGRRIGAYTVRSVIARGGMGTVYLAEQANPRRKVALKVVRAGLGSLDAERRFKQETAILARLHHPHIAQVYEAGTAPAAGEDPSTSETDGASSANRDLAAAGMREIHVARPGGTIHYFAMEYVHGAKTLTDYAAAHDLSISDRLELFCQVCEAVDYGHGRGVIHRDLKPQNVLVDDNGVVKVIDFGVARSIDSDVATATRVTEAGTLIGTLSYMSPEQCDADPLALDVRSDVYSLGVMLYELLCGKLPYDVSKISIYTAIRTIRETPPQPLADVNRRLRGDLQTIVDKALMKKPEERYARVADLCRDVRHHLRREPIEARPATRWVRAMRWMMRHPKLTAALGGIGISGVIVMATMLAVYGGYSRPFELIFINSDTQFDEVTGRPSRLGNRADLKAAFGNMLHTWDSPYNGISLAELVEQPSVLGGRRLALIGFNKHEKPEWHGKLCCFDAHNPTQLLWSASVDQATINNMPDKAWPRPASDLNRTYHSENFQLGYAQVADIYNDAENPGPEIVACFTHLPDSQSVIRIYNLNGDLLFQAWLDGIVHSFYWLADYQRLVLTGPKSDIYDGEYGIDLGGWHPPVIFAISPRLGDISNRWIYPYKPGDVPRYEGDPWTAEQYIPDWYKGLCPLEHGHFSYDLSAPLRGVLAPSQYVQALSYFRKLRTSDGSPYCVTYTIDHTGEIVARDTYNNELVKALSDNPSFPKPEDIQLLDWVSRDPPCEKPAQSWPMQ